MLQLFQTKDGPFFFIVTLVYTSRAFFALLSENICPMYCFGHGSSQSVSQWNSFSPLKYIVYKCFSCFRPGMGHFFHRHTCLHLSRFFCCIIRKYLPIYCFGHSSSQSVLQWNSFFSFKIHCLQMFQLFQTRDGPIFFIFHRHTCLHLSRFFCCIIRKYLSHILFWSQFVSICFAMKLFFSFKIHCLQMLQLFQSKDGPFFSSSHLFTLVALFLLYHQKIFIPYIVLVTARLSLFCNGVLFLL